MNDVGGSLVVGLDRTLVVAGQNRTGVRGSMWVFIIPRTADCSQFSGFALARKSAISCGPR